MESRDQFEEITLIHAFTLSIVICPSLDWITLVGRVEERQLRLSWLVW